MPVKPFADHCRLMASACAWEIGGLTVFLSPVGITPMAFPLPEEAVATILVCTGPVIIEV